MKGIVEGVWRWRRNGSPARAEGSCRELPRLLQVAEHGGGAPWDPPGAEHLTVPGRRTAREYLRCLPSQLADGRAVKVMGSIAKREFYEAQGEWWGGAGGILEAVFLRGIGYVSKHGQLQLS